MRLPNVQKWDRDRMAEVGIAPWNLHEAKQRAVIFKDQVDRPRDDVENIARASRRVYIKATDIENYGYTSGCPKCEHAMRYGKGRTTVPHSELCRQRIMTELAKTDAGQQRIAEAVVRLDRAIVRGRGNIAKPMRLEGGNLLRSS